MLEEDQRAPIPVESARRSTVRIVACAASIAACLLIAVGWFLTTKRGVQHVNQVQPAEPFSFVAMVQNSDSDLKVGHRLGAETIQIHCGIVRLIFDDGRARADTHRWKHRASRCAGQPRRELAVQCDHAIRVRHAAEA